MNAIEDDEALVLGRVERSLGQLVRYLRFDAAVLFWYLADFDMLWPVVHCGTMRDRVPPTMPGEKLVDLTHRRDTPLIFRPGENDASDIPWLRHERAETVAAIPVVGGGERRGIVVAFSRRKIDVPPTTGQAVRMFAGQIQLMMQRAPLLATSDLQRYQIKALNDLIGAASEDGISSRRFVYRTVARQAQLLTGARTVSFRRAGGGHVFRAGSSSGMNGRSIRTARPVRVKPRAHHTRMNYSLRGRSLVLGLGWGSAFHPTAAQLHLVDFIGHVLAAIDSVQGRVRAAKRERLAQYKAHVSRSLGITLDPAALFERMQQLFVPEVADCVVFTTNDERIDESGAVLPRMNLEQRQLFDALPRRGLAGRAPPLPAPSKIDHPTERFIEAVEVPMTIGDRALGTIVFGRTALRGKSSVRDDALYAELTAIGASALRNARSFSHEHHLSEALQRALKATPLPKDPRAVFGAAYVAGAGLQIGGDWYDVFPLDGNRYGISIGDVGGHGATAATIMNVVRLTCRAAAIGGLDPVQVLLRADAMLALEQGAPMVTAIYGVVDLKRTMFSYACAGHMPPYIAKSDGTIEALPPSGYPLGIGSYGERELVERRIEPGDTLVFYTDGMIEYGHDVIAGEERLRGLLATLVVASPGEMLAQRLHDAVFAESTQQHDDTAILTIAVTDRAGEAPVNNF